jgi:hypothetical protein
MKTLVYVAFLFAFAFWAATGCVALHFITKWW